MAIVLSNGVTLPDFPEGVFDKSQYVIITRMYNSALDMYSIRVIPEPAVYFPPAIVDEYGVVGTLAEGYYTYNCVAGDTTWTDAGGVAGSFQMQVGLIDSVTSELVWSSHDIYTVTSVNTDTGDITVGDEIYFPNSEAEEVIEYIATSTDLKAVADAIRSKCGTTEQLVFPEGFTAAIETIIIGGSNVPQATEYEW